VTELTSAPNVLLRGGPPSLSADERRRLVSDLGSLLKLLRGNRYEHFSPTSETVSDGGRTLRVFQWITCTYIAE
jgi:hypothetical protein